MIKNRNFIFGLGIGLILGAVLLQLMILGERSMTSLQPQDEPMTREQVEQEAKALNLKVVDDAEELMTEQEWKEKIKKDSGNMNGTSVVPPSKADVTEKPDSPQTPEKPEKNTTNTKTPVVKEPSTPKSTAPAQIRYVITKGSNLSNVADGLEQVGVITDKQAFIKAATVKKINQNIQTGTFTFIAGEDYDSIIKKISEKPSSNLK